jgi:hypothetical protein
MKKQRSLRALKALDARRNGLTLRDIGDALGVTKERARQLIIIGKKIERHPHPKHELNPRIRNALSGDGCEPTPDAVADRYKTIWQLKRGRGMAATLSPAPQEQEI